MGLKFKNKKTKFNEYLFDSRLETTVFQYLKAMEAKGEISNIRVKPNVRLTLAKIKCIPDFVVTDTVSGLDEYYEAKGFVQPRWRVIKKLWEWYGPGVLHVVSGSYKRLIFEDPIIPKVGNLIDKELEQKALF